MCLVLALAGVVAGCGPSGSEAGRGEGAILEGKDCLVLLPKGYTSAKTYPLLLCLHPAADGRAYLEHLRPLADDGEWILAASTVYRNDTPHTKFVAAVKTAVDDLEERFAVRDDAIFVGGFSGGGMAGYVSAFFLPGRFAGVLSNDGALHHNLHAQADLRATGLKRVAILSGRSDTVVPPSLLEQDKGRLEAAGIQVLLADFAGAHALAPVELYRKALRWLAQQ